MNEQENNPQDIPDAVIETTPTENTPNSAAFIISRGLLTTFVVAALFLAVGLAIGFNLNNDDTEATPTAPTESAAANVTEEPVDGNAVASANDNITLIESGGVSDDCVIDLEATLATLTNAQNSDDPEAAIADIHVAMAGLDSIIQSCKTAEQLAQEYFADNDPYIGPEDAPVVIVEFSDFLCGFCGRHFQQTLTPLLTEYDGYIRYVFRDYIGVGGQNAYIAAIAAECAHDQDRFWDYHRMLFNNQDTVGSNTGEDLHNVMYGYAETLNLDMETFDTCFQGEIHRQDIIDDMTIAQENGVSGTPGFFINGEFVSGAQPYERFAEVIDRKLADLGIDRTTG